MLRMPRLTLRLAAAALAFFICFGQVLASFISNWSTNALYSYGFVVPIIAAYISWSKWNLSREQRVTPDYAIGIPVILVGVGLLVVGQVGALITLQQASLIVTLTGLLLLLFGRDTVRSHWFVIAYLFLMIPIWTIPISRLQNPSRILSAKIAASLLDLSACPCSAKPRTSSCLLIRSTSRWNAAA